MAASALVVAVSLVIHAQETGSQSVEIQLQLGNVFFGEGRYQESLEAYQNAVKTAPPDQMRQARGGVIQLGASCGGVRDARGRKPKS